MPLDAGALRGSYSTTRRDGLYAEFHADGSLKLYGYFVNAPDGSCVRRMALGISSDRAAATFEDMTLSRFPEDGDPPEAEALDEWARGWIGEIERAAAGVRCCSFCQKRQAEVRKLIAGPTQYICDACVRLCSDILETQP